MDLSSIMNEGDAPVKKPSQSSSPDAQRPRPSPAVPPNGPPGLPLAPVSQRSSSASSQYPQSASAGTHGYPPPQSPAIQHGGHYAPYFPPSASSRSSNQPQPNPQSSPTHRYASTPQQGVAPGHPSHSPTPSHLSQTPHSIRRSPLSGASGPGQPHQPPPLVQYHSTHSQPGTPLAPPALNYQRLSGQGPADVHSPQRSRTLSGASNGVMVGSPAQYHPSIGNLVDSPGLQHRPQPQSRRTSDNLDRASRERSVSVSPKTMIRPSFGSRHSSQTEMHSARSSIQPSSLPYSDHGPHATQRLSPVTPHSGAAAALSENPSQMQSMRPATHQPASPVQHHQVKKFGMDHLLAPAAEIPAVETDAARRSVYQQRPPTDTAAKLSPTPAMSTPSHQSAPRTPLKRAADSELVAEQPNAKRGRSRKYIDRPIWARLAAQNPNADRQHAPLVSARPAATPMAPNLATAPPVRATNGMPTPQDSSRNASIALDTPWEANPPLDTDLIRTRQILGPWEKSIKWVTPYPDMVRAVQDWLYVQLSSLGDVGNDPVEGAVEIEAKIGHIISKQTDERLQMPLLTATVLNPSANEGIRFESQMDERAHAAMNKFLNATIQASMATGRVRMHYEHPRETDSFRELSPAGIQALPPAFQRRPTGRNLRLRTTTDNKTGQVTARIVKIGVADLHIFNPTGDYDCRISINLEVNLNRPDLAPYDHLTIEPTGEKPAPPQRKKDRLSYKHLVYSIDLTKVEISNNLAAKHELELEVDARILREQMQLLAAGNPKNAFGDIVSGFLDNATFLMRQRAVD